MVAYVANNGQRRKPAIGRFGEITVEQARGIAQDWLADVRKGQDPSVERSVAVLARTSYSVLSAMAHPFICPNCGHRTTEVDRNLGFTRQRKGCTKCGFAFLFELLDDYYPAPDAAFFVCDGDGRVVGCGKNSFAFTGVEEEDVIGQHVAQVIVCAVELCEGRKKMVVPVMAILGRREKESRTVTLRERDGAQSTLSWADAATALSSRR